MSDDKEILNAIFEGAKDDLEFFSNPGKTKREVWVAHEFLKIIGVSYKGAEVSHTEQSCKADILFRDACFQIKELPNPDIKRGKRVKEMFNSVKKADKLADIHLPAIAEDVPPVTKMYELVTNKVSELSLSDTYTQHKQGLDLLIYITRTHSALIQEYEISNDNFNDLGWRSVSCFNSKQAVVLFAASNAPEFLRRSSKQVVWVGR